MNKNIILLILNYFDLIFALPERQLVIPKKAIVIPNLIGNLNHYSKNIVLFIIILFTTQKIIAQKYYIQVSAQEIPLNETVDISFTIENGNLDKFIPPKFEGFDAYGPFESSQTSIINGDVSRLIAITYTLQPKAKGTFTIPAAKVIINGKKYTSKPFTIKVTDAIKPSQQQNANSKSNTSTKQKEKKVVPKTDGQLKEDIASNIFVRVIPNKSTVYKGEQVTLTYKLYLRTQIQSLYISKMPTYSNFIAEDITIDLNQEPKVERYNGQNYYVSEIKKVNLFPQSVGKISVEPIELQATLMVEMPDPFFNDPFFTIPQPIDFNFKNEDLSITVLPLPQPQPKNFSGIVGNYNLQAYYDKTNVKVGEPIQLSLNYTNTGSLKPINPPKLSFPDNIEIYPPKIIEERDNNGNVIPGNKTIKYTLVPQDGGQYTLPAYQFCYFNIEKKQYITLNLLETKIEVIGKAKLSLNLLNFKKREKEEMKQNELQANATELNHQTKIYGSPLFYSTIGFSCVLFLLGFFFRKKDYNQSELLNKRRSKANKMALKRLKYANTLMKSIQEKPFYNEVIRALWQYISDKLHITTTNLSKENMALQLTNKNIQQDKIDELIVMLNNCEEALFASQGKQDSMQQTYQTAINWITDVDMTLNKNKADEK